MAEDGALDFSGSIRQMGPSTELEHAICLDLLPGVTKCVYLFLRTELCELAGSGASAWKIYIIISQKKIKIDLWGVKLQHKVPSIFVRDEIFENIRRIQRVDKGKHRHPFTNPLCLTGIFEIFVPNKNASDFML